ncbi:MAG: adenosylhomocysteinase [Calditrichia bacterium]|nr:adenosylhomocysteinase [Calditrichia bacterium]
MKYDVKSIELAPVGKERILWADRDMPVLQEIRERFIKEQPLKGKIIAACLHVTAETANLMRTFKAGGAATVLCASNPLSTQDDVAASLVKDFDIPVFAIRGEDNDTYYKHIHDAIAFNPDITLDDGCDLVTIVHQEYAEMTKTITASMEETTTGIVRLKAMEKDGALKIPVFSVNDADTKYLFDNRYGTGQSTLDGIIRATDLLIAGKNIVTVGYGWCGRGFANRVQGHGANIIVTEVDPVKSIEAALDGFRVMTMEEAAAIGDVFCTLTGNIHVIRKEHFEKMKDGAVVCNSGHFNVEIDIPALEKLAVKKISQVKPLVDEYHLENGNRIYLLAEGRLINLSAAEGHPASVMDMSFATQALTTEYAIKEKPEEVKVFSVPDELVDLVALLKLKSMGITIDELTEEQIKYLSSWEMGT